MAEFQLQRRIPPYTERELYFQFRNAGMNEEGAAVMAHDMHKANMEDIYRLAKIGEVLGREPRAAQPDPQALTCATMEYLRVQCPNCHARPQEWCNLIDKYGIIARPTFQICSERMAVAQEPI